MNKKIVEAYGLNAQLDICCEECGELIHALIKAKRAAGVGYHTPITAEKARAALLKSLAHAPNAMDSVAYLLSIKETDIQEEIMRSDILALNRL